METSTEKKTIEILWTGGLDSTFRVVQLSMLPVKIQPYYIRTNRKSESMELNAIEEISKILRQKPATRCELLPLIKIQMNERIISEEITNAYHRIKKQRHLGSQYEYLGSFATKHQGIEIGIENWNGFHNKFGCLTKVTSDQIGDFYIYDLERSPKELHVLFQNYHFPIAFMTKLEIKEKYIAWGTKDLMELTWFCYTPIDGQPCGKCRPCILTIEAGMKERFSKKALFRYWRHKIFTPIRKFKPRLIRKIKYIYQKITNM